MTSRLAAVFFAVSFAGAAFAQEATPPMPEPTASVSRAQVEQELAQAKAQGQWFNGQEPESNAFYGESSRATPNAAPTR